MEALVFTAFIGGLLMFLAPCTLPLIPAFFASIASNSTEDMEVGKIQYRLFFHSLAFTSGFCVIFTFLGVLVSYVGDTVTVYKSLLAQIGGFIVILFGLSLLGVFRSLTFSKSFSFMDLSFFRKTRNFAPAFLGALFALGWAPCAGPILASILILTSQSSTVLQGGLLLFVFSLGLAIPFILTGLFYGRFYLFLRTYGKYYRLINYVSAFFLIVLGIVLAFGQYIVMTRIGFSIYTFFGYTPMCAHF